MSEKRNVPTFQIFTTVRADGLIGPIVSPDKRVVAVHLEEIHDIFHQYQACLIYVNQWVYVPFHAVTELRRGNSRFALPWPLVAHVIADTESL